MNDQRDEQLRKLLSMAQDGDRLSYELFLKELSAELRPFLMRQIQASEKVEDVLQEILISVHKAKHTYDPAKPIAPWVYAIARNRMMDFFRSFRSRQKMEFSIVEGMELENKEDFDPVNESDQLGRVETALRKLPWIQRQIIQLLKIEEKSVKDVAADLQMSEGAVKMTASRGYKAIRKALGVSRNEDE